MNPLSPYMFWIKIGAAVAAAALISLGTWFVVSDHYELKIADMVKLQQAQVIIAQDQAAHKQAAADKITHDADVANAEAHQKIRTIDLGQKVADHVTPEIDKLFPLPCGFVRMHNAYASNTAVEAVSLPAGKSDSDKCDVTTSEAVHIIGDNYGLALGWRADSAAWERWYADQAANWNKPVTPAEKPSLLQRLNPF